MSGHADVLTKKEKQRQNDILGKWGEAGDPMEALEKIKLSPEVGLVEVLWKVTCRLWNGKEFVGYTNQESFANACQETFGWPVEKEEGRIYKYSKSLEVTEETRGLLERIGPPDPEPTSWKISQDCSISRNGSKEKWARCFVQKGLWWVYKLCVHSITYEKTGILDEETFLVPKDDADVLLPCLGEGAGGLPSWVRIRLEESAKQPSVSSDE